MRTRWQLGFASAVLLAFGLGQAAYAQDLCPGVPAPGSPIIGARPFTAGPVNPKNGGALWIRDTNGVTLQLCLDPLLCFFDPVVPDNAYSERVGFGPEAFWWLAEAQIDNREQGDFPGFSALIVMGAEFAWNTEEPAPGDQFPFTRLRFRMDVPAAGSYYVTHPYGKDVFVVEEEADGSLPRVFVSFDIPFNPAAQNQGRVGPFLTAVSPVPPAGYVGSGVASAGQTVTGSPCNTNYFEIRALDPNGGDIALEETDTDGDGINVVRTTSFAVMGQIATRHGVDVRRATYTRGAWDPGIEVFASTLATNPAETLAVQPQGATRVTMDSGSADPTGVSRGYFAFIGGDFRRQPITVTNTSDPAEDAGCLANSDGFGPSCESAVVRDLIDTVTIAEAYHYRLLNELEIVANSSDELTSCPSGTARLTAFGDDGTNLGNLTLSTDPAEPGYILRIVPSLNPGVVVPPSRVTVRSCFGGSDTEPVDIGLCARAGNSQQCRAGR